MSAHSTLSLICLKAQGIVVIILLIVGFYESAFANPVYTYGGEFNLQIPAEPNSSRGWMNDAIIEIPDHFIISDLNVSISLTHSNVFDLQIFLQSPSGTIVCLNKYNPDEFFKGADYNDTIFDDQASIPIEQAESQFTGRYKPRDSLSAFNGEDAYGLWRLRIYDAYYADTGRLDRAEIIVPVIEPATAVIFITGVGLAILLKPRRRTYR
jgi:subtilisin-like proprotein convertase family protein